MLLQSHHHSHHLLTSNSPSSPLPLFPFHHANLRLPPPKFLPGRTLCATRSPGPWLAEGATEAAPVADDPSPDSSSSDGPIELPPSSSNIFAISDEPTPLQVATSVLLTGAISVFAFRSVRRRAKRAKELRLRSSGEKKEPLKEAVGRLNMLNAASVEAKAPPSPVQALLGALAAGVIALILYKFTTTIEAALNRQSISDNFSVRQITITIRTIVNGLCYLATFVFGVNSIGLFLYAGQLALNSVMGATSSEQSESGEKDRLDSAGGTESSGTKEGDKSDSAQ